MIIDALLNLIYYIVSVILFIFPESDGLPSDVSDSLVELGGYVGVLEPILPVTTVATIFALIVTYEIVLFTFKGVMWLWRFVPLIGTK